MDRSEELEKIKETFGLDPREIGLRFRDFWVVQKNDPYISYERKGYLLVSARDGAGNEPDCSVGKYPNYVGTVEDDFDRTYRYYYFKPIKKEG